MKKKLLLLPLILGMVYVLITSYSGGPAASAGLDRTGASGTVGCSGGACHGASSSSTTITIKLDSAGTGTIVNHYVAGCSYKIIITGTNTSSGSLPKCGCQMAVVKLAGAGTTSRVDAGSYPSSGYPSGMSSITVTGHALVEHSTRLNPTAGAGGTGTQYSLAIPWIAPATPGTGTVKVFTSFNAVNNDGAATGDAWNSASDTIPEFIPVLVLPILGSSTTCVGSTTILYDSTHSGTWSSSNTSVASINPSTGVVFGVSVGSATITYTTGLGFVTLPFTVTASPSAGTLSGPTSVCQGTAVTLSSTVSTGTWASSNASIATVSSSGSVYGNTPGTVTITYTVTSSCGTARTFQTMTVNPSVSAGTLAGPTVVCVGTTGTLSSTISGGVWTSSAPLIATINPSTGLIAGVSVGSATITYSVTGTCGVATHTYNVTVNPAPSAGVISGSNFICRGSTISLGESVSGGTWSSSNTSVATITSSGVVSGYALGNTVISYAVAGTCGTIYAVQNIHVDTVAYAGYIAGPSSICIGAPVRIYDSLGAGGTWISSTPTVATIDGGGYVTGVTAGSTTITYLIPPSGSCGTDTAFRTISIFVGVPAIGGPTTTCVNQPIALTNSVPSGLWSSSNAGVALAAAGFGTVTGVSPGTATISYTTPAGCRATTAITVNPIPTPITGVLTVCPNATTTLTDTSRGGVWVSADSTKARVSATGVVTGRIPATVTIYYKYPSTGCYASVPVVVNPDPTFITGNAAFCKNSTDTVGNLTIGGTWSSSTPSIMTISSTGVITGVTAGVANITYTLPTGCHAQRQFTVHPLPNPIVTFAWYANTFSTDNYYVSYVWKKNGVVIPGATLNTVAGDENADYTVTVVDTFGCSATSSVYSLTNLAVHQLDYASQIHMIPNPASTYVKIEAPIAVRAVVMSLEGKMVMEQANVKEMDITSLTSGIYMVLFYDNAGNKLAVEKLVKQ